MNTSNSVKIAAGVSVLGGAIALLTLPKVFSEPKSKLPSIPAIQDTHSNSAENNSALSAPAATPPHEVQNSTSSLAQATLPTYTVSKEWLMILANQKDLLPEDYQGVFGSVDTWISTDTGGVSVKKTKNGEFILARAEVKKLGRDGKTTNSLIFRTLKPLNIRDKDVLSALEQLSTSPESGAELFSQYEQKLLLVGTSVDDLPTSFYYNERDGVYQPSMKNWDEDRASGPDGKPRPVTGVYTRDGGYYERFAPNPEPGKVTLFVQIRDKDGKIRQQQFIKPIDKENPPKTDPQNTAEVGLNNLGYETVEIKKIP